MRREDGSDRDPAERCGSSLRREPNFLHAQQRPAKGAGERRMFPVQFAGAATTLAVVGLGEIGEFEVSREGLGDVVSAGQVHPGNNRLGFEHERRRRGLFRTATHCFAMLNQQSPQLFHRFEQILTGLLHQHLSEDCAERAHVAPERIIFSRFVGPRGEFGQTRLLIIGFPQRFGLGLVQSHRRRTLDRINDAAGAWDEKSESRRIVLWRSMSRMATYLSAPRSGSRCRAGSSDIGDGGDRVQSFREDGGYRRRWIAG